MHAFVSIDSVIICACTLYASFVENFTAFTVMELLLLLFNNFLSSALLPF